MLRTNRPELTQIEQQAVFELAEELDGLPLALEQAGAYISTKEARFTDYIQSYRKRKIELLDKQLPETGDYGKSVATTWSLNFEAVEQKSLAAACYLRISAFLSPSRVPEEILVQASEGFSESVKASLPNRTLDPLVFTELLSILSQYSLISRDIEARTFDIHRLVQAVIISQIDETQKCIYAEWAVKAVYRTFPEIEFENWSQIERIISHGIMCIEHITNYDFVFDDTFQLLGVLGKYLGDRSRFDAAEQVLLQLCNTSARIFGKLHKSTASANSSLACLYYRLGKYQQSAQLHEIALPIIESTLGSDDPETAMSQNNLACAYAKTGLLEEALALHNKAFDSYKTIYGMKHEFIADSLSNQASVYLELGDDIKAEEAFLQALEIRKEIYGYDHPDTAKSLNNLASIYSHRQDYATAASLAADALKILHDQLGENHAHTAMCKYNLGTYLALTGNRLKGAELSRQAMVTFENVFGPDHKITKNARMNYDVLKISIKTNLKLVLER